MNVLITGICGFVGSALAECLLERREGISILGIDNLVRPGSEANRAKLRKLGVRFVHGDVRVASDLESLPAADWVIDAAANPSVLAGVTAGLSSRQLMEHNLLGVINVLEYCKIHRSGLVLLSTSRVYSIRALVEIPLETGQNAFCFNHAAPAPVGVSSRGLTTAFSTAPPISLYGSTKLASEAIALEYGELFNFPVWIDRCGVLAGAGQFGTADQGIFSYWINAHLRRRPLRYIGFDGTGKQVRDALHPRDLCALLDAQMNASPSAIHIFNVGGGPANSASLLALNTWCDQRFGAHRPEPDLRPRPFDVPWLIMDNSEAQKTFGWRVETSLDCILGEIAQHAEQHPDWLETSNP